MIRIASKNWIWVSEGFSGIPSQLPSAPHLTHTFPFVAVLVCCCCRFIYIFFFCIHHQSDDKFILWFESADFHPVEINSGRFARSAPATKAPAAARAHHAGAPKSGAKVTHHAAGHRAASTPAAKASNKRAKQHQKRQVHPHKAAAAKERSHQDKKHQVKKAPAKRLVSAHTSNSQLLILFLVAALHHQSVHPFLVTSDILSLFHFSF